ncbi:hypothetical protein GJV52_05920 [Neisseria brasiliensis]|uniref:Uncharacterized protein n=1 Tax=Neisseria brasiliensis TaxID=2666100 RepID=A0A5Q3RYN2_9NEIS|nr:MULTISPECIES: hypothetical protein [Neisseria]MRN38123.1 hypothetical protein [Neisseria brasiliensis]QGL25112.1 hypothetical protein GJV52_05920 [Neisseria brasiliensis]
MGAVVGATMSKGNPVAAGIGALVGGAVAAKNSNSCQTFTSKDKSGNNYGERCGNNYGD